MATSKSQNLVKNRTLVDTKQVVLVLPIFFLAKFDASWCIFTSTQDSEKYNIFKKNLLKKKYHDHLNEEKKGSIT
jgi:hypothetical protein